VKTGFSNTNILEAVLKLALPCHSLRRQGISLAAMRHNYFKKASSDVGDCPVKPDNDSLLVLLRPLLVTGDSRVIGITSMKDRYHV
jgi:hypothetical protein